MARILKNIPHMKTLFLTLFIFWIPFLVSSQSISDADKIKILQRSDFFLLHDVPLGNYKFDNENLNVALRTAMISHRKMRTNNIFGSIFLGYGVLLATIGITAKPDNPQVNEVGNTLAGSLTAMGVVFSAGSIPFFISAGKRKKDREKALLIAKGLIHQ